VLLEAARNTGTIGCARAGTCIHDDVDRRQFVLMSTERLTHKAFDSVSIHSVADDASGD
jgi:hypothetical protein